MDLLTLIQADTPLTKMASTGGGEWAGPCPFCGGRDRFRVQPERGRWWCRQCSADEHWEDTIAYLRKRDGIGFHEAQRRLSGFEPVSPPRDAQERPLPPSEEPSPAWRSAAEQAALQCTEQLWSPIADRARTWLYARGLEEETLRRWSIGYSRGETLHGLWIPRGIVLPWYANSQLWQLKIRCPATRPDQPRYASVKGGRPYLFGQDHLAGQQVLVLTEGELDALLLWQEARHRVDVATLGSCASRLTQTLLWELMPYRRILLAYDADAAGDNSALKLQSLSHRLHRIRIPHGKDVTDFQLSGGQIKDWIAFHC